jgi:hypothetical protein
MSKKYSLLVSIVLLLTLTTISSAVDRIWDNGAGDGNWTNAINWASDILPNTTSDNAKISMAAGPVFSAGRTATAYRVSLGGTNGTLTMSGGTLTANNHIYAGVISTDTATLNMSSGDVNIAGTFYVARDLGSTGTVSLSGGTISCNALSMRMNNPAANGTINITSTGKLIITGDVTATINTYVTNGWIKAYNGAGTVYYDYNITTTGKTTVWTIIPTKAGVPSPANNATNVSTLTDLSWIAGWYATSHDVYFGTNSSDVNSAHRLLGDLNGNGTVDWNDISRLTEYWLLDPIGSDPYAGVDDDNIVDFFDYALLSQDWKNRANPVFKGNQDANSFDPGTLTEATVYYWRIDEVNSSDTITGDLWKFTTVGFANIRKGPYLIYPGINTQMTVLWQVDVTSTCNIAWGTDTSYSLGSTNTTEYGTDHQHKYNITGLTPGTKYYYRVTISGVQYTGNFYAAPAADATAVKFFMYGDTRTNGSWNDSVCARMISTYTADAAYQTMVLHAGDWVEGDTEAFWTSQWWTYSYTNLMTAVKTMPFAGCVGNHEFNSGTGAVWAKYWAFPFVAPRYNFSFDYGPVHVTIVDQYTAYTNPSTQYTWLVGDLSASTKPWKILIFHQPAWNAGGTHGNDGTAQTVFQPLCQTYGVQICLAGHNHFFSRCAVKQTGETHTIQHVTQGAGGAPYYSIDMGYPYVVAGIANTLCVAKVEINGDTLTCTTVRADNGNVVDTFTLDRTTW